MKIRIFKSHKNAMGDSLKEIIVCQHHTKTRNIFYLQQYFMHDVPIPIPQHCSYLLINTCIISTDLFFHAQREFQDFNQGTFQDYFVFRNELS
jgi:hypothetical protein